MLWFPCLENPPCVLDVYSQPISVEIGYRMVSCYEIVAIHFYAVLTDDYVCAICHRLTLFFHKIVYASQENSIFSEMNLDKAIDSTKRTLNQTKAKMRCATLSQSENIVPRVWNITSSFQNINTTCTTTTYTTFHTPKRGVR